MAAKEKDQEAVETASETDTSKAEEAKETTSSSSKASDTKSSAKSSRKSSSRKSGPATMEVEVTATRIYHDGRFRVRGERLELTRPQIERVRGAVKPAKE